MPLLNKLINVGRTNVFNLKAKNQLFILSFVLNFRIYSKKNNFFSIKCVGITILDFIFVNLIVNNEVV